MKQAAGSPGLLPAELVRELVAKSEPDPEPSAGEQVTVSGSPAAIAKLIHGAPVRKAEDVAKEKNDTADRKHKAATGAAMSDGSYPIASEADLTKAIHAVGRGGSSHNAIRAHIISRARSLGASSKIPDNWAADGSLKETSVSKTAGDTIAKADGPEMDEGIDGMDPMVPLAAPVEMAPGDPTDPGSPAWEAIDAATACKWTSILARAKAAIDMLAEREMIEAVSADPGDADSACDLTDACCAIDFAIGVLAPFAVAEQSEADCGAAAMAVSKAMAGDLSGPLGTIEALAQVRKAGRVLSAANEAAIKAAADSLNKVLMSLPQAPAADETVTKEAAVAADQTSTEPAEAAPADVAKAEDAPAATVTVVTGEPTITLGQAQPAPAAIPVAKADSGAPCVVYDAKGQPMGIVDMTSITAIQGAAPAMGTMAAGDAKPDGDGAMADPAPAADDAMAPEGAPCPDPGDMTPQPAAEAGVPADEDKVAKAAQVPADGTITQRMDELASTIVKAITAAFGSQPPAEDVAKQADVVGELSKQVETLKGRLETVENQPAAPRVFTNGAVPPPGTLRGQDAAPAGGQPVDVAKARELKGVLYNGTAPEQKAAFDEMQQMAVDGLAALYGRRA